MNNEITDTTMYCKDCIHYDLCDALARNNGISKIHPKQCNHFINKEYVKILPCRIGELVYNIYGQYRNGSWHSGVKPGYFRLIDVERFGKTVFSTYQDAVKALKEYENDT